LLSLSGARPAQKFFDSLGILALQGALLVDRNHWNPGMDTAEGLSLLFGADAIRQLGEPLMQARHAGIAWPRFIRQRLGSRVHFYLSSCRSSQ
jgi:hypothetical protein